MVTVPQQVDTVSMARHRLLIHRLSTLWFTKKDDQPPKGFEKFFKKKEEGSTPSEKKPETEKKEAEKKGPAAQ